MAESSNRYLALVKLTKRYIKKQQNKKTRAKTMTRPRKGFKTSNMLWALSTSKTVYQANKCLEARSKRLTRRQGKGNNSNAAVALTDAEVKILYEEYLHQVFEELAKCLAYIRRNTNITWHLLCRMKGENLVVVENLYNYKINKLQHESALYGFTRSLFWYQKMKCLRKLARPHFPWSNFEN